MKNIFNSNKKKLLILVKVIPKAFKNSYSSMRIADAEGPDHQVLREKFIKKYGLTDLKLVWPDNNTLNDVDYIKKNPDSISMVVKTRPKRLKSNFLNTSHSAPKILTF